MKIVQALTREQAIVISAYTGILACPFDWLLADIERRLGRPMQVVGLPFHGEEIKDAYRADFIAMCPK
jgi:hypothetical protein